MIVRFENKKVKELYELETKAAVSKYKFAAHIIEKYKLRIGQFIDAPDINTLRQIKSLHLEKLKANRTGQMSVRVNDQYRICFKTLDDKSIAVEIIELTDYH